MPKGDLTISSGEYAPVASRIALFYDRFPRGRIITDLISRDGGEVIVKASVYRSPDEREPAATGWAAERVGDGEINTVACVENTETSAIGRALANLGFTASSQRPSREEMTLAARRRAQLADDAMDLLELVRSAERRGLSARRAEILRRRIMSGRLERARGRRLAVVLRAWTNRAAAAAVRSAIAQLAPR